MATVGVSDTPVTELDVDAVIVGLAEGPDSGSPFALASGTGAVDVAMDGRLTEALTALGATGAVEEVSLLPTLGALRAPLIAAVGLGRTPGGEAGWDADVVRRASGAAVRALPGRASVASTLALIDGALTARLIEATATGALLGAYEFRAFTSAPNPRPLPGRIEVVLPTSRDSGPPRRAVDAAARSAGIIADAVCLTRDLVNTPAGDLPPSVFADRATSLGRKAGLDVEVLDEKALAKAGYGGILAVGGGSARPPRLVRLHFKGPKPAARVALVGKGITFDSGGISLKPAENMHEMKIDMTGAAAMLSAIIAAADLELPLEITATLPIAENMPGGSAYRPGDVITHYGGTTVEVLNTDAEGRLVLADAFVRACEDEPQFLLEASTLTGAQIIALGKRTTAVIGSDGLRDVVVAAAGSVGEAAWPLPLPPELRRGLDSLVADLANVADNKAGGTLVAGHFLSEFVADGVQWAHLDVAGPSYNSGPAWGHTPRGATGVPVRTVLATLAELPG